MVTTALSGAIPKKTIAFYSDGPNRRKNNYDFIRIAAAVLIILAHSFVIANGEKPASGNFLKDFSQIYLLAGWTGMSSLFILGGFLIAESYARSKSLFSYLRNRCLRIMPGFICVMLLMTFIVGPLLSTLPIQAYFGHTQTYQYLLNLTLLKWIDQLPGVFQHNPATGYVNGSLWTIRYETYCYISVLLLGLCRLLSWKPVLALLVLCSLLNALFAAHAIPVDTTGGVWYVIMEFGSLYVNFLVGVLFYTLRDRIALDWKYALCALGGLLAALFYPNALPHVLLIILAAYLVFYFAYASPLQCHDFAKYGDLSYGTYIYAWPIQQMAYQWLGQAASWWTVFAISLPITLVAAFLSWHLLEKKVLRLKGA